MRTRVRDTRREIERIANTPTLGGLFLSFLKIGTVGFGGGLAVIAQIRTLAVLQRRWLTEQEFAPGFALAQTLPGTAAGKLGRASAQTAGTAFAVTVNAVDADWNLVNSINTVGITTTDPNDTHPANAALSAIEQAMAGA